MTAKLLILGSANAITDEEHENTHLAVVGRERMVLIDCINNPRLRLQRAGLSVDQLTDLIVTHFHPDHVSGVPLLLMDMWLRGREQHMNVYGLNHTIDRLKSLMVSYNWDAWPSFFPLTINRLPEQEGLSLMQSEEFDIISSPVCHIVPTVGLRIVSRETGRVVAYSCDTEPCESVVNLAKGADVLLHECAGAYPGHATAAQAGEIAKRAGVSELFLIHYPVGNSNPQRLINQARSTFDGPVALAEDFMEIML